MKILRNIYEIADFVGCKFWEVEEQLERYYGHGYCVVNGVELQQAYYLDEELKKEVFNYIYVNIEDNADCKEYLMKVELPNYTWKVYVDDLEKWQFCKVKNISNTGLKVNRATVVTDYGTEVNRVVKFAIDEEDIIPDRCIYFYEK